jgi:hypothetical protein
MESFTIAGFFISLRYKGLNPRLELQLAAIRIEIELHEEADVSFKQSLASGFKLANKGGQLFESSKTHEKTELVNFLFSNLALRGRKLEYTLRRPFDAMVKLRRCLSWLLEWDDFRTFQVQISESFNIGNKLSILHSLLVK